ncbi:MAG TPA: FAD-dependent oxidoreductase [Blastocatellia bacterium]|nr:FAD-dependent oxidoreductase [Blastocatellia bacterium]
MTGSRQKRVVILGGGFGGVYTAKHLEKALGRRDEFEIVLVNKENYFVFQPMLPEVISGSIGMLDTVSPIRRLLPRTNLHVRDVESIDINSKTITTSPGFRPHAHIIEYDYLVLAMGNVTDFRGLRGLPEHAMPFKNLADAVQLRNHVIRALEEAAIEDDDPELRSQLLTFVVAGGGFSGVEVAAELNDFVREVARNYRSINPTELRVVLVHSQNRILPELSEKLALFAQKILMKRGVEVRLNTKLEAATGEEAILAGGEKIGTRTLVSTVPSSPHPIIDGLDLPKGKNGRLITNSFLEVEGAENIWALGDCAQVPQRDGGFCPPTAQHALRQGRTAAGNIVASIRGGKRSEFTFGGLGQMGALGHHSAVAQIMGVNISGFIAWWIWRTIYLLKLPGWGRRLKVASSWTLDLLLPAELVELKLTGSMGITQEHFEPGEEVFHQGDLGDRIYIIVNGEAEVVREDGDLEIILAKLGSGEYFGEMALLKQSTRGATVRCTAPMDTLSLPKREFSMLAAYLPQMRETLESVMEQRTRANAQKSARG